MAPPGGGDQHHPPRAPEASVSQDQNGGHQHDPVGGHPSHPQRRVHVVPVPQHRRGRLSRSQPNEERREVASLVTQRRKDKERVREPTFKFSLIQLKLFDSYTAELPPVFFSPLLFFFLPLQP